jgi:hypothetical protein
VVVVGVVVGVGAGGHLLPVGGAAAVGVPLRGVGAARHLGSVREPVAVAVGDVGRGVVDEHLVAVGQAVVVGVGVVPIRVELVLERVGEPVEVGVRQVRQRVGRDGDHDGGGRTGRVRGHEGEGPPGRPRRQRDGRGDVAREPGREHTEPLRVEQPERGPEVGPRRQRHAGRGEHRHRAGGAGDLDDEG